MPIQIYSINTRGHNMGGSQRCNSKEEAEALYATLLDAVTTDKPICELELNGNKVCFRTKDLTGFGLHVHLEETPEEIKARQIAQIEAGYSSNGPHYDSPKQAQLCSGSIGGGLI